MSDTNGGESPAERLSGCLAMAVALALFLGYHAITFKVWNWLFGKVG